MTTNKDRIYETNYFRDIYVITIKYCDDKKDNINYIIKYVRNYIIKNEVNNLNNIKMIII